MLNNIAADNEQLKVINKKDGSLLVLSGAGSGKTFVYVKRIENLINNFSVKPHEILCLTFSKKAAQEIRERLKYLKINDSIKVYTFHSFGNKLLRLYPEYIGFNYEKDSIPTLLDKYDYDKFVKDIIEENQKATSINKKIYNKWLKIIDICLNKGIAVSSDYAINYSSFYKLYNENSFNPSDTEIESAWSFGCLVQSKKEQLNLISYNDLIVMPMLALENSLKLSKHIASQYKHILIDEFQDTNVAQYRMLKAIALHMGRNPNIMAVGDDDQSIYEWRGANPENLKNFEEDYKPLIIKLEHNYRSNEHIVKSASNHIKFNMLRMDKKPFSDKDINKESVFVYNIETDTDMVNLICNKIEDSLKEGFKPKDISVLFRMNFIATQFEVELKSRGIKTKVIGLRSIFDYKEIKYILNVLKLILNKRDIVALDNISKKLEAVGQRTINKIKSELINNPEYNLWTAISTSVKTKSKAFNTLMALREELEDFFVDGPDLFFDNLFNKEIINVNHILSEIDEDKKEEANKRIEIIKNMIYNESRLNVESEYDYEKWDLLTEIMLTDGVESENEDKTDFITLSSIHQAKGLEWEIVHIPAFVQGIMPSIKESQDGANNLFRQEEEERRISYVAMTRAKKELNLYCPKRMFIYGKIIEFEPSYFIKELNLH